MQVSGIAAVPAASDGSVRMKRWSHWWTNDLLGATYAPNSGVSVKYGASTEQRTSLDKLSSVVLALTSFTVVVLRSLSAEAQVQLGAAASTFLELAIPVIYLRNYLFGAHYIEAVVGRANAEEVHHELYQAS